MTNEPLDKRKEAPKSSHSYDTKNKETVDISGTLPCIAEVYTHKVPKPPCECSSYPPPLPTTPLVKSSSAPISRTAHHTNREKDEQIQ